LKIKNLDAISRKNAELELKNQKIKIEFEQKINKSKSSNGLQAKLSDVFVDIFMVLIQKCNNGHKE